MRKACGFFFCLINAMVFLMTFYCCAQEDMIVNGEIFFSKAMVDEDINLMRDIVKDGNSRGRGVKEAVFASQILSFIKDFDRLEKMPEIERVTGYSREWFASLKKTLELMFAPKVKMETAFLNRDEKTYLAAMAEYEKNRKMFLDTVKNPKRASGKKPKS